jgi:two-component sensor histidine kinase
MENLLAWLPAKPQPLAIRYGATTIIVGVCFLLVAYLQSTTGIWGLFLMFPAIFLAAVLFDRGSGFLATALSTALLVMATNDDPGATYHQFWFPLSLFVVIGIAVATISEALRKGWERAITAEHAMELLYRELSHRTKNNFAMASAVLRMQARSNTDPDMQAGLMVAAGRLQVMSKAHEQFEPVDGQQIVDMQGYLQSICDMLKSSIGADVPIDIHFDCEPVKLPVSRAIPLGLMTNELVTNAYKHAFTDGRPGTIAVRLHGEGLISFSVEDNGAGCADNAEKGVGTRLTELFVRQLGGTLRRERLDPGCRVSVSFAEE